MAISRYDSKWAHPEILEDNGYTVDMGQDVRDNVDPQKAIAANEEMVENMNRARNILQETPAFQNIEWLDYEATEGCPEEPEAPPVQIIIGKPTKMKEREKIPAVFCVSGGGLTQGGVAEGCAMQFPPMLYESGIKAVIVCFTYRIVAYGKYPAAVNDCHAAYQWMIRHAEELQIDTDKILIWGMSSGGHLGFCTGFRLKRYQWCGAPMPRGMVLQIPAMDDVAFNLSNHFDFSRPEGGRHAGWDGELMHISFKSWLGDQFADPELSPEAVPNRATLDDVKGMPPLWIPSEAEFDCGRDSTYRMVQLFHEAGVFCDFHVWGATSHHSFMGGESDFAKRISSIAAGAIRDALTFDFRRPWLKEDNEE